MARTARIHPAIGIARLGNSEDPDGFFLGPERPLDTTPPPGGYRDANKRLKRQGARFRIFLDNEDGSTRELTLDDADIVWTVEVANSKAAGERFHGAAEASTGLRNARFVPRTLLTLNAPATHVSGRNQSADIVNQTPFMNVPLPVVLATARTDADGRLIVVGGFGKAGSPTGVPLNSPGSNFANHDGWFDDTCDGRITATVTMHDGSSSPIVKAAWVISAPPKFAPTVLPVVTMYDTLRQIAIDRRVMPSPFADPSFKPSFTHDVYPILARAIAVRWLYAPNGDQSPVAVFHNRLTTIPPVARDQIFAKLRKPAATPLESGTGTGNMPRMWSDLYPNGKNGTLTPLQYQVMQAWKDNQVIDDWQGIPGPVDAITPEGLDRAALEPCVGGAFYPGIEASWHLRDRLPFIEPFRLDAAAVNPGDVTAQMSLPWQSDFLDCAVESGNIGQELTWWPAQRPIDVRQTPSGPPITWARAFDGSSESDLGPGEMVVDWWRLGHVLPVGDALLEHERQE
jgi:hypothetical protein